MSLKNAGSRTVNTFDKIQKILAAHGANRIMFDYKDGLIVALKFSLVLNDQELVFNLPAMTENVIQIMYGKKDRYGHVKKITDTQREQGYKTAWANIRDWIDAQMAMIDTKQVKMEQVMLPYLIVEHEQTLFEKMEKNEFLRLN